MTAPRQSLFFSPARERSQQARVLLIMGLVLAFFSLIQFVQLPGWKDTLAVSDDQRIYLVGRTDSPNGPVPAIFASGSPDGLAWSVPIQRDLDLRSAAASEGWLYLLLKLPKDASQLNAYGPDTWNGKEDWKVVDLPSGFTAFGVGALDGRIWVFGPRLAPEPKAAASPADVTPKSDKTDETPKPAETPKSDKPPQAAKSDSPAPDSRVVLNCAYREGAAWVDGPSLTLAEGEVSGLTLVSETSGAFLYWRLTPPDSSGPLPRLYRASFDLGSFGPVESFDLPGDLACTLVGEPGHTLVLAQDRNTLGWPVPPIHRFVIENGKMGPASDVVIERLGSRPVLRNYIASARFHDKTWLLASGSSYGVFLNGIYAFQLDGSRTDAGALALAPSGQQLIWIGLWLAQVLLACALLAAALVGYGRKLVPLQPPFPDSPLIAATVLERAVATALDFGFMVPIPYVMIDFLDRSVPETIYAVVIAWFAYTILSESSSGRTLGKRVVGLQVLGPDRLPPVLGAAILRNLLKPIELLTFGPALILGSARSQRLADRITGSVVVFNPILPPPPVPKENDSEGF